MAHLRMDPNESNELSMANSRFNIRTAGLGNRRFVGPPQGDTGRCRMIHGDYLRHPILLKTRIDSLDLQDPLNTWPVNCEASGGYCEYLPVVVTT